MEADPISFPPRLALARLPTPLEPLDRLREFMGIRRTTFIIGRDGRLRHVMDKVKTASHQEDVPVSYTHLTLPTNREV